MNRFIFKFIKSTKISDNTTNTARNDTNVDAELNSSGRKKQKLEKISQAAKEVLVNSTSHGIPNIIRSENLIIKLVWLLFLLASTGLCSFLVAQSIFTYYNYDVNTKTRTIYETQAFFPTITICNKQKYTTRKGLEFLKNVIIENNLTDIFENETFSHMYYIDQLESLTTLKQYAHSKIKNSNMSAEEKKSLGLTMSKALVECSFDGLSGACDENHFNWVYNKNYGNCYVINSGFTQSGEPEDTVISSYAGKEYGLTITMFLGVRKELRFLDPNHGLILKIDNRSNGIIQDPIEIPAGYETNIAIEREFTKQLANPFSNCDLDYDDPISFDKKYHDALAEINIKYEQSVCFQYCYQTMLKHKCNCSDRDINSFFDLANCYSDLEFKCLNDIYHQFVFGTYLNDMCKPFCPLECNKTRFNIKTATTKKNIDYNTSLIENFAIFTGVLSLF